MKQGYPIEHATGHGVFHTKATLQLCKVAFGCGYCLPVREERL